MKTKLLVSAIAAAFILSACGKKTEAPAPSTDNSMASAPATTEAPASPASDAMAASAAASAAASDATAAASSASSPQ